jgi:putative oxidoreductase
MSTAGNTEGQINRTRLLIPGLGSLYETISPYSYAVIRFIVGAVLIYHGYGKLFVTGVGAIAEHVVVPLNLPMPMAWAYLLGILEFFGGIALALGFLVRPIALMLTVEFIIITAWHWGNGYVFASPHGGYEYPLVLTVIYGAIFFRGAGRCSIDHLIGKEL